MTQPIKLGMIVKDPTTGVVGTASAMAQMLSGTTQFAIQPAGEGGTVPDSIFVDDFLLEVVGVGVSERVPAPDETVAIRLGEHVEDIVTGIHGIAMEKMTYLNGCVYFAVLPKAKKDATEPPKAIHLEHKRLKRIGDGLLPAPTPENPTPELPKSKTGGPNRRVPAMRL